MKIGISLPVRELKDDLGALREFAQAAEELGLTHLRIPDQVMRPGNGHLHEPMMLLAYLASVTHSIELVPSVIVLPSRQTVLFAKQAAELDVLCAGRLRLGIGAGKSKEEYQAQGSDFHSRGARCTEQMQLLKRLWTEAEVNFKGRFDTVAGAGLNPLPVQRPIPMWIGAAAAPVASVVRRIGLHADGWFVLASPDEFGGLRDAINGVAKAAGRDPSAIGAEAGVAVVGPRQGEWQSRVEGWREAGLTHLCLRTLGGDLGDDADAHLVKMRAVCAELQSLQ